MNNEFTCDGMTRGDIRRYHSLVGQTGTNECMKMHCSVCFVTNIVDEAKLFFPCNIWREQKARPGSTGLAVPVTLVFSGPGTG